MNTAEQISIFDIGKAPLKIDKPIRLIELFAGIGSQAKALERLGADFEHYRVCEFDKYAIKSYNAIHGTNFETSDITQITSSDLGIVDTDKYCYIMTYSFPCQDLSLAGLQKGMAKGDNTRSGLLWEVERLLNECDELPQILLMENVTQVHGKKNIEHFNEWIEFLESKGYSNYWQDLNAKNYGVPQNRNRTFMVSVLGNCTYEFPQEIPLELRLKDMLEDSVDEKYYLKEKALTYISKREGKYTQLCDENTEIAKAAITSVGNANWTGNFIVEPSASQQCVVINPLKDKTPYGWHFEQQVYDANGITRAVKAGGGSGNIPKVITTRDNDPAVWDGYNQRIRAEKGAVGTLTSNCGADLKRNGYGVIEPVAYDEQNRVIKDKRIRKLTPKECWRLMEFDDADFDKAAQHNSNAQLYKQAGNSIVVDVLVAIFKNMF